jgi:hypothetical protein
VKTCIHENATGRKTEYRVAEFARVLDADAGELADVRFECRPLDPAGNPMGRWRPVSGEHVEHLLKAKTGLLGLLVAPMFDGAAAAGGD